MPHKQLDHYEVMARQEEVTFTSEIILLLDDVKTASNIAGIFRIADALQIKKILLLSCDDLVISKKFRSIARVHEKDINFQIVDEESSLAIVKAYAQRGYHITALELTSDSVPLPQLKLHDKYLLIAGAERHGIRSSILAEANQSIHIPMQGKISSLNVMQAVSLALYELRRTDLIDAS